MALLTISSVIIIITAAATLKPTFFHYLMPLLFVSIIVVEWLKPWVWDSSWLNKGILIGLTVLILIPYANYIALPIMIIYLLINGLRNGQIRNMGELIMIAFAMFISLITKQDVFVWIGASFYLVVSHLGHTKQLVAMLVTASENVITDALTGIYNRRWLYKKTEQILKKQEVGIIFCDIDNFKTLNDTKGHDYGDDVLQKTAEIMRRELNGYGYACRYGGEELVGLVVECGRIEGLAEKILEAVRKEINITMSIGLAVGDSKGEDIIKLADKRMYTSKETGKNKITFENNV